MIDRFSRLASNVRSHTGAIIRDRQRTLAADLAAGITTGLDALDAEGCRGFAELMVRLMAAAVESGALDPQSAAVRELASHSPPLTTRHIVNGVHRAERIVLDEVALDETIGATSDTWAIGMD